MIFTGKHWTHYQFDNPVTLGPHAVRLQPRSGAGQVLRNFLIHVDPVPETTTECLDQEGNILHNFWFLGSTDHLTIRTSFEVETFRDNPFDFVPLEGACLPPRFASGEWETFTPALRHRSSPNIDSLAHELSAACTGDLVDFAVKANLWINTNIACFPRETGAPFPPDKTLERGNGACRDLAVLLVALCRAVGVPARFVSGYQDVVAANNRHELHAWTEVWLPGGGWRGFDPSQGLAVTNRHIALAASASHSLAAPVIGRFGGASRPPPPSHRIEITVI